MHDALVSREIQSSVQRAISHLAPLFHRFYIQKRREGHVGFQPILETFKRNAGTEFVFFDWDIFERCLGALAIDGGGELSSVMRQTAYGAGGGGLEVYWTAIVMAVFVWQVRYGIFPVRKLFYAHQPSLEKLILYEWGLVERAPDETAWGAMADPVFVPAFQGIARHFKLVLGDRAAMYSGLFSIIDTYKEAPWMQHRAMSVRLRHALGDLPDGTRPAVSMVVKDLVSAKFRDAELTHTETWLAVALALFAMAWVGETRPQGLDRLLMVQNGWVSRLVSVSYQDTVGSGVGDNAMAWIPGQCNPNGFQQFESPTCYLAASMTLIYNTRLYHLIEQRAIAQGATGPAAGILWDFKTMVANEGAIAAATGAAWTGLGTMNPDFYRQYSESPWVDSRKAMEGRNFKGGFPEIVLISTLRSAGVSVRHNDMPTDTEYDVQIVRVSSTPLPMEWIGGLHRYGPKINATFVGAILTGSLGDATRMHAFAILVCEGGYRLCDGACFPVVTSRELRDRVQSLHGGRGLAVTSILAVYCTNRVPPVKVKLEAVDMELTST